MRRFRLFAKGPVRPLVLLIILSIISLPFLIYSVPYSVNVTYYPSGYHVPPGYFSESYIGIYLEEGYHDKKIEINIIECVGDWVIEPENRNLVIKPGPPQLIILRLTVPEDSKNGDEFFIQYEIMGDYNSGVREKMLLVIKDLETVSYPSCPRYDTQSGSDIVVRPEIFGIKGLMVISSITLFIIANKDKKSTQPQKNRQGINMSN